MDPRCKYVRYLFNPKNTAAQDSGAARGFLSRAAIMEWGFPFHILKPSADKSNYTFEIAGGSILPRGVVREYDDIFKYAIPPVELTIISITPIPDVSTQNRLLKSFSSSEISSVSTLSEVESIAPTTPDSRLRRLRHKKSFSRSVLTQESSSLSLLLEPPLSPLSAVSEVDTPKSDSQIQKHSPKQPLRYAEPLIGYQPLAGPEFKIYDTLLMSYYYKNLAGEPQLINFADSLKETMRDMSHRAYKTKPPALPLKKPKGHCKFVVALKDDGKPEFRITNVFFHATIALGDRVIAVGEMTIAHDKIVDASNHSGGFNSVTSELASIGMNDFLEFKEGAPFLADQESADAVRNCWFNALCDAGVPAGITIYWEEDATRWLTKEAVDNQLVQVIDSAKVDDKKIEPSVAQITSSLALTNDIPIVAVAKNLVEVKPSTSNEHKKVVRIEESEEVTPSFAAINRLKNRSEVMVPGSQYSRGSRPFFSRAKETHPLNLPTSRSSRPKSSFLGRHFFKKPAPIDTDNLEKKPEPLPSIKVKPPWR